MSFFIRKFSHALNGWRYVITHEPSAQVEIIIFCVIIFLAWYKDLSYSRLFVLAGLWLTVLVAEIYNTALEKLVDIAEPRLSLPAAKVKNILAGGVLLYALVVLTVSVVLFLV